MRSRFADIFQIFSILFLSGYYRKTVFSIIAILLIISGDDSNSVLLSIIAIFDNNAYNNSRVEYFHERKKIAFGQDYQSEGL